MWGQQTTSGGIGGINSASSAGGFMHFGLSRRLGIREERMGFYSDL
jgi:hypothetical protein